MKTIAQILGYTPIDTHSHFDHGVDGDLYTIASAPARECHRITLDFLCQKYDSVGVGPACFSTYASVSSNRRVVEENRYLHQLAQENNRVYQWVVVEPTQPETFDQAAQMLKSKKTIGIKIHPKLHEYDILEHGDKLFSFAHELGAVVQMHPAEIPKMPAFADKYPNMKLIIAHLGHDVFMDAVAAAKHGNIFVDTSGSASHGNNVVERAVKRIGAEHILFGTDGYSSAFQLARIAWADISDGDKKKILRDNALALFPGVFE